MVIQTELPLLDAILADYKSLIGKDFNAYNNHVYRMVNLTFAAGNFSPEEQEKIQVAGAFHDIGLWTKGTLDYLPPSRAAAVAYLEKTGRKDWIDEVEDMIEFHHRLRACHNPLIEAFRRADIADFSLGLVPMGFSRAQMRAVKKAFPNQGFHPMLVKRGTAWFLRNPLNPLPMFRR